MPYRTSRSAKTSWIEIAIKTDSQGRSDESRSAKTSWIEIHIRLLSISSIQVEVCEDLVD